MAEYFIQPFVDTGLGNSAYLIGSDDTKKGILIDPLRDVDRYLHAASERGLQITHVLDTHLHADFVSGNLEIAKQTGALIGASAEAHVDFQHHPLEENSIIDLGAFKISIMSTPGHSPEHISFLVVDADGKTPSALFSGGALIVGGAARTDLLGHEHEHALASHLYHTIHEKLLKLPDEVNVYPTHGAGSFCIAPASSERTTTIGNERKTNPLAQPQSEEAFIKRSLTGLPSYPTYYKYMRAINQHGPKILGGVPVLKPLGADEVKSQLDNGAVILDVRGNRPFSAGHIPNAYAIRVDAPLVTWAGWVIPFHSRIILVADSAEQRIEAARQLIRIGYDDLLGYLDGGVDAWVRAGFPVDTVQGIDVKQLRERLQDVTLIDVRMQYEWDGGHIPGAIHMEGGRIAWEELNFPQDKPLAIQCASGNRSMIVLSVLKRRGFKNLIFVEGGYSKWLMNRFEVTRKVLSI